MNRTKLIGFSGPAWIRTRDRRIMSAVYALRLSAVTAVAEDFTHAAEED